MGRIFDTTDEGQGYAGWPNWETWWVFTTLTNDEGLYAQALQVVWKHDAAALKEFVADILDVERMGLARALVEEALNRVSWFELWKDLRGM